MVSWNVYSVIGAGVGDIGVEVEDPQGKNTVELLVEDKGNQVYRCVYKPMHPGPHVVKVTFAGDTIPKSPFIVQVGEGECWGDQPRTGASGIQANRAHAWVPDQENVIHFCELWSDPSALLVLTALILPKTLVQESHYPH